MKQDRINEQQLQDLLHALPDREVPGDLAGRIMAEINNPRQKIRHLLARVFSASFTFHVQPVRLTGAVCALAAAFWLGLIIGDHGADTGRTALTDNPPPSMAPGNAEANHLIGRGLLAGGQAQEALKFLQQASLLDPRNPEYALWEGVAVSMQNNKEGERQIYRNIIRRYPGYLPARINLGHNLLETGQLDAALTEYNEVLDLDPAEETALYNRALVHQLMKNNDQEAAAWKEYLQANRQGKWAYRAVSHLNALGDFTYRSYQIGFRRIILNQDVLLNGDSEERQREIEFLAASFARSSGNILNVIVFQTDDDKLAGSKALNLKNLVSGFLAGQPGKEIQISWFGKPENLQSPAGKQYQLPAGLLIFSQPKAQRTEEKII